MPKINTLLLPLLMGLSSTGYAQVYKSTDADGNVVFSDTPAAGSEEIQVSEPNVADSVEVPAYVPPDPAAAAAPEVTEEQPQPVVIVINEDDDDDDGSRNLREKLHKANRRQNKKN